MEPDWVGDRDKDQKTIKVELCSTPTQPLREVYSTGE